MPIFSDLEIETVAYADIEFEVFCSCGKGICSNATTRLSAKRNHPQVVVKPCEDCIEQAINPLQEKIEELEQLLNEAREHQQT